MSKLDLFIPSKPQSHRQDRVCHEIQKIIAMLCSTQDLPPVMTKDQDMFVLKNPISITRVTISPDLHHATVYFRPLLNDDIVQLEWYLNELAPYFRTKLAKSLPLKKAPTVQVTFDQSLDEGQRIDTLLNHLKADLPHD